MSESDAHRDLVRLLSDHIARSSSPDADVLDKAEQIALRIDNAGANNSIADLERLKAEIAMFVRQGRAALAAPAP